MQVTLNCISRSLRHVECDTQPARLLWKETARTNERVVWQREMRKQACVLEYVLQRFKDESCPRCST